MKELICVKCGEKFTNPLHFYGHLDKILQNCYNKSAMKEGDRREI